MKKVLSVLLSVLLLITAFSVGSITASADEFTQSGAEFVQNIKVGWNLGNTMESWQSWGTWPSDISTITPEYSETGWYNPKTTQSMIDTVHDAGFNAIRVPITWRNFIVDNGDGTYTIRAEWINRIKEIVGYAQKNDMYVIINMHHDDRDWLNLIEQDDEWNAILEKYRQVWQQIATAFKDYNEKLILEAANELLAINKSTGDKDWWGQQSYYFSNMTKLYKCFIETVRSTGGNNAKRYLMLPTYAAQWYSHQVDKVYLPSDDNHIIMDVHWYTTSTDTSELNNYMSHIKSITIDRGYGAVFGECGLVKSASNSLKKSWPSAFIGTAKKNGISCLIWDDGGDFQQLNRNSLTWLSQSYIDAIIDTVDSTSSPTITTKATTSTTKSNTTATTTISNASSTTTTAVVINGEKVAFYKFTQEKSWYNKAESWNDPIWGELTYLSTSYNLRTGAVTYSIEEGSYDKWNQINSNWNDLPASDTDVYVDITNNTDQVLKIKFQSVPGYTCPDDDYLPTVEPGDTYTLKLGILTGGETFGFLIQGDQVPCGENLVTVSALYTVDETKTTTTITTTATTTQPSTAATATSTQPTVKPSDVTTATQAPTATTTNASIVTTTINNVLLGDCNGDGTVTGKDILLLRKYIIKLEDSIDTVAADVNKDDAINEKDVLMLRKAIIGLIKL